MAEDRTLITARLDVEPPIFKGCSLSEITTMVIANTLLLLPVSLIVASMLGSTVMGFGLAGILLVVSVLIEATIFNRLKQNRPLGYYQQAIHLWLARKRLIKYKVVTRSGVWDLGRD